MSIRVPDSVVDQLFIVSEYMKEIDRELQPIVRAQKISKLYRFLNNVYDEYALSRRSILHNGDIYQSLQDSARNIMTEVRQLEEPLRSAFVCEVGFEVGAFISLSALI